MTQAAPEDRVHRMMTLILEMQGDALRGELSDREVVFLLHLLRYMDGSWIADVRLDKLAVDMGKDVSSIQSTMRSLLTKWRGTDKALFKREPRSKGNIRVGVFDLRPMRTALQRHRLDYVARMKKSLGGG